MGGNFSVIATVCEYGRKCGEIRKWLTDVEARVLNVNRIRVETDNRPANERESAREKKWSNK